MNDLQIITGGAGDDEVKVYTGRADSRARSGGETCFIVSAQM